MAGIAGRRAQVRIPGTAVVMTGEACTNTGDNKTYRITNALKRILSPTATITVKVGGTTTAEVYTLNRLAGTITFATVNAGRAAVTVDGSYMPMANAARASSYSYALSATLADDTDFDTANTDAGFHRKVQTQLDVSGTIGGKWSSDIFFRDALLNADYVVLEFFPDRAQTRTLACWSRLEKSSLSVALESLHSSEVGFTGTTDSDGRAASQ